MEFVDVFYDGEIIKNACHLTTVNFHVENLGRLIFIFIFRVSLPL